MITFKEYLLQENIDVSRAKCVQALSELRDRTQDPDFQESLNKIINWLENYKEEPFKNRVFRKDPNLTGYYLQAPLV